MILGVFWLVSIGCVNTVQGKLNADVTHWHKKWAVSVQPKIGLWKIKRKLSSWRAKWNSRLHFVSSAFTGGDGTVISPSWFYCFCFYFYACGFKESDDSWPCHWAIIYRSTSWVEEVTESAREYRLMMWLVAVGSVYQWQCLTLVLVGKPKRKNKVTYLHVLTAKGQLSHNCYHKDKRKPSWTMAGKGIYLTQQFFNDLHLISIAKWNQMTSVSKYSQWKILGWTKTKN